MPTDFSAEQDAQFEADLNRARGYKPVTAREMRQAYAQYKDVGLKFGQVTKGMTDEQLYAKAEKTVLAWWKAEQKEKATQQRQNRRRRRRRASQDPRGGRRASWSGGSTGGAYRQGGTGGSGGGSGYAMLPDTAMREGGSTGGRDLPDIRGGRMSPREVRQTLNQMGVPTTWNPPTYAERSPETLEAWVNREAEKRDLVIRASGAEAYLNNSVVRDVANRIGFPIDPKRVPYRYRQTVAEITNYLLMLKRQAQRRRIQDAARQTTSATDYTSAAYLVKMRNYE